MEYKNWFKDWFSSEDYLKVYNHRDSRDAEKLSELIIDTINPRPNDYILDAACGAGRHGLYFASKGFKVIGFDLSMTLLLKAKEEAERSQLNFNLIQTDIREVCFKKGFFAVLNLFTSFGYFESEDDNFRFVKHSKNFLIDNGFYVLDYFNICFLKDHLVPFSERVVDDLKIIEERKIIDDRVIKKIELENSSGKKVFHESVRLYQKKHIIDQFSKIGFKLIKLYGNYEGADFDEGLSPRLIAVFQT